MATPDDLGTGPDMTAGELALGLLEGEERAGALCRVLAEPAFAREVKAWRTRFAALYETWPAIEPGPAAARRAATIPDGGRRDDGARWRWLTAVSSAAAAVLLGVVVLRPAPAPIASPPAAQVAATPMIVVLKQEKGAPFGGIFDPATREIRLAGAVALPADRAAELWAIGEDGVPHAAGLLTRGGGRLVLARGLGVAAGTTFAISIEPIGGSPKPTPTGPVVASGKLSEI